MYKSEQTSILTNRPKYELSDIFREYGRSFEAGNSLAKRQHQVLFDIQHCRTQTFGYHVDVCDTCNHVDTAYNSCRNRHCNKCQGINRRKWVNERLKHLLPVPYHHSVFTLPHYLFPLIRFNQRIIYTLLFDSAAETLMTFGKDPKWLGAEIGFFGILHTWSQTLWQHPHVHFIVTAGGLSNEGQWIEPKYKSRFLFPVRALSKVFRGKFVQGLKAAYEKGDLILPDGLKSLSHRENFERWIDGLVNRNWVVFNKAPFAGPEKVVKYIGRYTHRVAISNHRILAVDNKGIRFAYKDYKDKAKVKEMTLLPDEFIKRFLWHVLPKRFHKIRHYGFLSNGRCNQKVAQIRRLLRAPEKKNTENNLSEAIECPVCGKGQLIPSLIINRFGLAVMKRLRVENRKSPNFVT